MPYDLSKLLVVAISSTALFDNRTEHEIYLTQSLDRYVKYQIDHEDQPFPAGTALPLIRALLQLNDLNPEKRLVEVVILSKMEPAAGIRVMNSVEHHNLDIVRAAFTGGELVAKYLSAYNVTLFLSTNEDDVKDALERGVAAGLLYDPPSNKNEDLEQLRIAFDGDAVIFSDEAEQVYQEKGIEAFYEHEKANAEKPLPEGPFASFLRAIAKIQKDHKGQGKNGFPPIQTALVTARNSPAHKRVILTLRAWGIEIDEMFFLGGVAKDQVLKAFNAHIFFDDQDSHALLASQHVPAARVPNTVSKGKKVEDDSNQLNLPLFNDGKPDQ
ncbi:MAG: 5'-nucleotidase [Acidobacteriota bacterium]|nr:5'-nucleotidase [Acidobacteriota bacterium]